MNKLPELQHILLRGPRTDENGDNIPVVIKMVRASEPDLSKYSFLASRGTYEEWVPTKELHLYQKVFGVKE